MAKRGLSKVKEAKSVNKNTEKKLRQVRKILSLLKQKKEQSEKLNKEYNKIKSKLDYLEIEKAKLDFDIECLLQ